MDNTIIQSGSFVSTTAGANVLTIRSDFDWIQTLNLTQAAAANQYAGVRFYWQNGMNSNDGVGEFHAAASRVLSMATCSAAAWGAGGVACPGFIKYDMNSLALGAVRTIVNSTNVVQPIVTTAAAADLLGLTAGAVIRMTTANLLNCNGMDFAIDTITPAGPTFRLAATWGVAPIACGAGTFRVVAPNVATYRLMYPSNRVIINMTAANPCVVTTSVDHGFTTGQLVRFKIPATSGMIQMDGLTGTVTNLTAYTFSVNIDATAFTAFVYPLVAALPFTPPEVIPVGSSLVTSLSDATVNQGVVAMILGQTTVALGSGPGGSTDNADTIYWRAGRSFNF